MIRTADAAARRAKVAEFKRLITSKQYDSLETLEEAVEAFLWGDDDSPVCPRSAGGKLTVPVSFPTGSLLAVDPLVTTGPLEASPLDLSCSLAHQKPR